MCCNRAACFLFLNCFFISLTTPAQDSGQSPDRNQGNVPRASAAKYHSHAQKDGFSLGAELLSRKEASSVFAANVNGCCLVVQVSVYPKKDEPTELSLLDFSLVESCVLATFDTLPACDCFLDTWLDEESAVQKLHL